MTNKEIESLYNELKKVRRTVKLQGDTIVYKTKQKSYMANFKNGFYNVYTDSRGYKVSNESKSFQAAVGIFRHLVGAVK